MRLARLFAVALSVMALVGVQAVSAFAGDDHVKLAVYDAHTIAPVSGDFVQVMVQQDRVHIVTHLTDLTPGDTVQTTFIVFSNPQLCQHGLPGIAQCGGLDFRNPLIQHTIIPGPTEVVNPAGNVTFVTNISAPAGSEIQAFYKICSPTGVFTRLFAVATAAG